MVANGSDIIYSESEASKETMLLETRRMNLHAGIFGQLFGSKENAPTNIVGAAVLLCLGAMMLLIFLLALGYTTNNDDVWKALAILAPIVTGALGYMFGKN